MIVEPRPVLPGRSESSGPEPAGPSPGTGDTAFGRTLTDVLRADRTDRPTDRGRRRAAPDDDRGAGTSVRRADRSQTSDDRANQRVDDDKSTATNTKTSRTEPATEDSADEQPAAVDDHRTDARTDADRQRSPVVEAEAIDERVAGQPEAVDMAAVEYTPALEDLTLALAVEDSTAEQVAEAAPAPAAGSAESGPVVAVEPVAAATTPAGHTVDRFSAGAHGRADADQSGTIIDEGGADGIDLDGTDSAFGSENTTDTAELINEPASKIGPTVEQVASSHQVDEADAAAAGVDDVGTRAVTMAVAGDVATVDRRVSSVPDAGPTDHSTDPYSSEGPDAAGVAPLDQRATTRNLEIEPDPSTGSPSPSPDAADLVDRTETQPGAGSPETVEQPAGSGDARPAFGLSSGTPSQAPLPTPIRSAAAAVDTANPAPELVELQTTGLAERLRPAFAAVRRGVNGLDELRLRIRDDNAGPIKVDIATIDNRVRVLLSAGNDDLMRQLGQERDRLADELRRAGFDRASIDIESNDPSGRQGRYDRRASDRSGAGTEAAGPGHSGSDLADSIERTSSHRRRGLTGLDLDL